MMLLGSQTASPAMAVCKVREQQRAHGMASVLSIGTASPANCVQQEAYADYYCRITKSDHFPSLKARLQKLCQKSGIKKRYFYHSEELLQAPPEFLNRAAPSLNARMDIAATAVPELASAAATKAVAEWGRPVEDITHLVVSTYSGGHMPGADFHLASLLGLRPSVQRTMLYMYGCTSGSSSLRLAKDIAENNSGARVLVACADLTLMLFRAPDEARAETLLMQATFGDGAGAVIVGADPVSGEEPKFEFLSASQARVPAGELQLCENSQLCENGLLFHPSRNVVPAVLRGNLESWMSDAVAPLGLGGGWSWNDLFWAVHPGGQAMLDSVEAALRLEPGKLAASRKVLSEYGNMSGPSVIFVLDELRRHLRQENQVGMLLALGPGLSAEAMVLRAPGSKPNDD